MKLVSYDSKGIDIIKDVLDKTAAVSKDISIQYMAAGNYGLKVKAPTYPEAEEILKKATDTAINFIEEHNGEASFTRDKWNTYLNAFPVENIL